MLSVHTACNHSAIMIKDGARNKQKLIISDYYFYNIQLVGVILCLILFPFLFFSSHLHAYL